MNKKTTFILGAVAIAACLILVASLTGFPPDRADTVGTIGATDGAATGGEIEGVEAADRYRTDQIDEADVTLDDPEIQELLQNDEVLKVVNDPTFQRTMQNDLARATLTGDNAFSRALQRSSQNPDLARALARTQVGDLDRSMSATEIATFARSTFDSPELQAKVQSNPDLARALKANADLARAINDSAELSRAVATSDVLQRTLANRQVMALMASPDFGRMVQTQGFERMVMNRTVLEGLDRTTFRRNLFSRAEAMERTTAQ